MTLQSIDPGTAIPGLLETGDPSSPVIAAVIKFTPDVGIEIEIPFDSRRAEFEGIRDWFRDEPNTLPSNMRFVCRDGVLSLFGNRAASLSMAPIELGTIHPTTIVFKDRQDDLPVPLAVTEMQSAIDGLPEWTSFRAVSWKPELSEEGRIRAVTARVESTDEFSWSHDEATFTIRASWHGDDGGRPGLHIDEEVVLLTAFTSPRSIAEHIKAQERFLSMLVLNFGQPLHFRSHAVRDRLFPDFVPRSGLHDAISLDDLGSSFQPIMTRRTVLDTDRPRPHSLRLSAEGLSFLPRLMPHDLEAWFISYDLWHRVIEPTVGLLLRPQSGPFDVVISANLSLEAAGTLLARHSDSLETSPSLQPNPPHRKPTTAALIQRCLDELDLDWSPIASSTKALAQGIANTYNAIKHFDRGALPAVAEARMVGSISVLTVRLLALRLMDSSGEALAGYSNGYRFSGYLEAFANSGLYVGEDGHFADQPIRLLND